MWPWRRSRRPTTGCRATAVAGGGATVTAAVTKGSETTNVASQITVSTTTDAFILVTNVSGEPAMGEENPTDAGGLKGRVTVSVSVERGSQTFEKLSLNVDGMEAASQDFGTPAADAEQTVHEFMLSFDSDEYDSETGAVDYMNGEHSLQALLKIAGRDEALMSNVMDVEFDNVDGIVVALSGLGPGALSDTGDRWYGGPYAAGLTITALPVLYSGGYAMAVGIGEFCGEDAASDSEAPFAFMPDCEGTGEHTAMFTVDGEDTGVLNEDVFPLNLDFDGPSAPYFSPNPNNRESGWVNATVDFGGEQDAEDNEDGWLIYNDDDDTGVGGYQPVLRYAEAGSSAIEDALAAAPLSHTNFPGESEMDAYCVIVSAVDDLGNESGLPDEDDGTCMMAGTPDTGTADAPNNDAAGYELLLFNLATANAMDPVVEDEVTAAEAALADAGLLAGLDITPPGIEIDEDMRINAIADITDQNGLSFDVYDDENEDHNSGLHSLAPLLVRIQRRDNSDTECLAIDDLASANASPAGTPGEVDNGDDVSCTADPAALAEGTAVRFGDTPATSHAYYTLWGAALDQAGNHSMVAGHTFVFDADTATVTAPAAPGSLEAGESFEVASFLNDDLSIRDYYVTADFPDVGSIDGISLGVVPPTPVDAFDAGMLTRRNYSVTADIETYAGLQGAAGQDGAPEAGVSELETVTVAVRDQAQQGGDAALSEVSSAELTVEAADDDGFEVDEFTVEFESSEAAICVAEDVEDCDDGDAEDVTETEFEVVATAAATGGFSEPFDRVDFWVQDVNGAHWMLGSVTSGESGRVGGPDNDRRRTWTYSLDATAMAIYMRTRRQASRRVATATRTMCVHSP